jgi:proline iminopeptidase
MSSPDTLLFPDIEPYDLNHLPTASAHRIYYEQSGNRDGLPVVVLHGGPGSGCTPMQRRFFDPSVYRIILFDQRGCKRSQPLGCIEDNTTSHLVDDLEALRSHLGIDRWVVFGGSWGSTLALAYALRYPEPIVGMILRGIFLCRPSELEWFLREVQHFFPEAWFAFANFIPANERRDLFKAYRQRVFSENAEIAFEAALRWSNFEADIMSLLPASGTNSPTDRELVIGRARVQMHYLANGGFVEGDDMLRNIDKLRNIPAQIIQGRYDMVCPPITAYELHQAWPEARFTMVPDAGHSAMEPGIIRALMVAAESFHPKRA